MISGENFSQKKKHKKNQLTFVITNNIIPQLGKATTPQFFWLHLVILFKFMSVISLKSFEGDPKISAWVFAYGCAVNAPKWAGDRSSKLCPSGRRVHLSNLHLLSNLPQSSPETQSRDSHLKLGNILGVIRQNLKMGFKDTFEGFVFRKCTLSAQV